MKQAPEEKMAEKSTWTIVAVGAAAVIAVAVVIGVVWAELGDSDMSGAGWGAMVLGIVLTLALGIGLMSLVFISNRRGYDEP
jgi:heme A synthase